MTSRTLRRLLLGCGLIALGGAAACDSPTLAPHSAAGGSATLAPATMDTAVAVADTTIKDLYGPDCNIHNSCPTTGTVTVGEPGGNVTIGTYGPEWTATVPVGTDTYKYQLGLTNGSFIGIIWKNGAFAGYWGYCLFPNATNYWYKKKDPNTGKEYIHWENHENGTQQMYHYIYDPSTNTLKVYHRQRDGSTRLIYQGAPIKTKSKLPPPDPAPGAGHWTGENQYTTGAPIPPAPTTTGGTTTGPTTGTTTTTTGSPTSTTVTNSPTTTTSGGMNSHTSTGGPLIGRP